MGGLSIYGVQVHSADWELVGVFLLVNEMAQRLDELEAAIKAGAHTEPESDSSLLEPLEPLEAESSSDARSAGGARGD